MRKLGRESARMDHMDEIQAEVSSAFGTFFRELRSK